jgi:hypothetical protein
VLAKELIVEHRPGDAGIRLADHEPLLNISSDGSIDPGEDGAILLHPHQAVEMGHIGEHVIRERIFAEDNKEEVAPSILVVGGAIQHDRDENLDVDDDEGLGVDGDMLRLVGIKGGDAVGLNFGGGLVLVALLLSSSSGGVDI